MKKEYTFITKANQVTVYVGGTAYTVTKEHVNYDKVLVAIKEGHEEGDLLNLLDTTRVVKQYLAKVGDIEIANGVVTHKGKVIANVLVSKILTMIEEGFEVTPMLNFLSNLRNNPSKVAQDELILFMEVNDMPITPDGHFLSYKSVNDNYMDYHTGTFSNKIGDVCRMERCDVDDRRENTCSNGLHIGAKGYAGSFGSAGHLMIVKVNPADVVSIPHDYNNMKGRVTTYEVIGEVEKTTNAGDSYTGKAVYIGDADVVCENCGEIYNEEKEDFECPHCGYEQEELVLCGNCGEIFDPEIYDECPNCGE